jgi:hypothetical protein
MLQLPLPGCLEDGTFQSVDIEGVDGELTHLELQPNVFSEAARVYTFMDLLKTYGVGDVLAKSSPYIPKYRGRFGL